MYAIPKVKHKQMMLENLVILISQTNLRYV